jgi:thiol-disulfide isomerase/thioredoxin
MKRWLLGLFICIAVSAQSKMTLVDAASYPRLIAAQKGKVVLTNFWATWCVPCRKEMPALVQLNQKLAARGFSLVMISADEPAREAQALALLKQNAVAGASLRLKPDADATFDGIYTTIDPKWSDGALPALFLYDRTGKKVRSFVGETPTKDIEAAIQKLL